ncbi:MAG: putative bifunctional diguanylate cyclase/phosphodiesterase [Gammaproteobacteria bacterium]
MAAVSQVLSENARLLKSKASRRSIFGVLIAVVTVVIATLLSAYFSNGNSLSLDAVINTQKTNPVLWVLDLLPFFFAFWGQYTSSLMAFEAGAMVLDQTNDLRTQTATLEHQIAHQSTHDSLTGLPNRALFTDRLEHALHTVRSAEEQLAVMILDLDGFKEINDTLGHYNGDRVLKSAATRMRNAIAASITLARLGGDEFGIILTDISGPKALDKMVHSIQKALEPPAVLEGVTINLAASMGAALAPEHGRDADTLMQRADVAMYVAKDEHRGYILYSTDLDSHSPQRLTLIGELRQAIQGSELELYYMPKVSGVDGQILGAEGLVRWNHPRYGLLKPVEFIPMAERTGIIKELSVWVIRQALKDMDAWHAAVPGIEIAINMTAHSLLDPEFPNVVAGLLAAREASRGTLCMEITESVLMADQERTLNILNQLSEMGIRIGIDDFGTGYSSMSYLKKLPIREIKIDQTFVAGMRADKNDAIIVNAIIQLAHNLGLTVTAEGVETGDIFDNLRELGCDHMQGRYIGMPMKASELARWMESWRHILQQRSVA